MLRATSPTCLAAAGLVVPPVGIAQTMSDYLDDAKRFADSHEEQVEQGLERGATEAEERTDNRYDQQIDRGVQMAEDRIGEKEQ